MGLVGAPAFAVKSEISRKNRCANWLKPEARLKRSVYVDKLIQYDMADIHSRVWERFLPRVRRWITDSEVESDAVRAFAESYFEDFRSMMILLNDNVPPELIASQLISESNKAPGTVLWIGVTPGSTLLHAKFRPLLNLIDSLGSAGKLVLIVYETGPTAFDFSH